MAMIDQVQSSPVERDHLADTPKQLDERRLFRRPAAQRIRRL